MKRKTIVGIALGVLLIGIVTAGLVGYLSNMVTATIEVKGPVFYAAPGEILLMNEEPSTHDTYPIIDGDSIIFWTEESLGGTDFNFIPKIDFYIRAKVNDAETPRLLELKFGYSDTLKNMHDICVLDINITTEELENYTTSCEESEILTELTKVNEFYYKIQGEGDKTIEYEISTLNTKVEMSKAT